MHNSVVSTIQGNLWFFLQYTQVGFTHVESSLLHAKNTQRIMNNTWPQRGICIVSIGEILRMRTETPNQ